MTCYAIKMPYLSKGLKKSYNKQIIVYEGGVEKVNNHYNTFRANACKELSKKGWKDKNCYYNEHFTDNSYFTSLPTYTKLFNRRGILVFPSFDMAAKCKYLALDSLTKEYEKKLDELRELCRKNIPDVTEEVSKIREEHPEMFI